MNIERSWEIVKEVWRRADLADMLEKVELGDDEGLAKTQPRNVRRLPREQFSAPALSAPVAAEEAGPIYGGRSAKTWASTSSSDD